MRSKLGTAVVVVCAALIGACSDVYKRQGHTVFTLLLPIVSGAAPAEEAPRDV